MKTKTALALCLALMLSAFVTVPALADNNPVELIATVAPETIDSEHIVTYEVALPEKSNISNLRLEICYDKDVLEAISTTKLFNKFNNEEEEELNYGVNGEITPAAEANKTGKIILEMAATKTIAQTGGAVCCARFRLKDGVPVGSATEITISVLKCQTGTGANKTDLPCTAPDAKTIAVTLPPVDMVTISFDANGGTGRMDPVKVDRGSEYNLPVCEFASPANKEFDTWDKGAVGEKITVSDNLTITALWKHAPVPPPAKQFVIDVSADPAEGGTVAGDGVYWDGDVVNVKATANAGYGFIKWTENGDLVSTDANYEFFVRKNRNLVAVFVKGLPCLTFFLGDVNGDENINIIDARWLLQVAVGARTLEPQQAAIADVNQDGKVDIIDARWLLQVATGARVLQ